MTGLPVRDSDDALRVNWLEITSARPDGAVTYRGTFVISLDVTATTSPNSPTARGSAAGLCITPSSKRKTNRMANGFHSEVHVQFGPIEVTRSWFLHV